jgi:uncharacterized protein DUF2382
LQGEPIQLVLPYPVLSAPPEKQMGDTPPESNATIELTEETISVGKRRIETGRVRVRIRTESEETQAYALLLDQDVEISRIPIGRDVTDIPAVRQEGDVTIYPEPLAKLSALSSSRTTYRYWRYSWMCNGMNLSCCIVF